MDEIQKLLIFMMVNTLAAVLSGAAGGGGGLISTPFLVTLGLSPATAIATAKFGGLGISMGSTLRFRREKIADRRTVIIFSIMAAIGAVLGSLLLVKFSEQEELLENIMGVTILLVGIPLLYVRNMGLEKKVRSKPVQGLGLVLLAFGVLLQASVGSGIGSLQMLVLIGCFGMTALVASATRRAMQITVAAISLAIFIATGIVDFEFGAAGFITSLVGGYIGAHVAIKKGNKFIVNLFAITSAILALQLLLN